MQLLTAMLGRLSLPLPLPLDLQTRIDGRLLGYTVVLTMATTVLCALAPALQATKGSQWSALRQGDGRSTRRWSLRNVLVVCQLAVALVLLATASLFVRNLAQAHRLDPGFDTENTLVGLVGFVEGRYTDETRTEWLERAAERALALPGVVAAGYAYGAPLTVRSGMSTGAELTLESTGATFHAGYETNFAGPGFFEAIGIRVLEGPHVPSRRQAGCAGRRGGQRRVRSPIHGRRRSDRTASAPARARRARRTRSRSWVSSATASSDRSARIGGRRSTRRTRSAPMHNGWRMCSCGRRPGAALSPHEVVRALTALDPSTAVEVSTMRDTLAFAFMPSRLGAALLASLGALGLLLAMAGLFAVVSYSVSRRTGEIGIRMALGADGWRVTRLVLRDAAVLTAIGAALGLAAAWFVTQPLAMFLVAGVSGDPLAFAGAASLLVLVSLAAAWVPARRAVRIDPVTALRCE